MAKKKETNAERREREKAAKLAGYRSKEQEKKAAEEARKLAEQEQKEREEMQRLVTQVTKNRQMNADQPSEKKTPAKAAGLKSAFILPDQKVLMTAFGRGNTAIPEKHISGIDIKNLTAPENFRVMPEAETNRYHIAGRGMEAVIDNPVAADGAIREDQLGLKKLLEEKYFGRSFEDNIHIQIIYNIMDMEKLLAVHVNNLVYTIDNVVNASPEMGKDFDLIGNLGMQDTYEEIGNNPRKKATVDAFIKMLKSQRLGYFGSAFCLSGGDKKAKTASIRLRPEKDIYYSLCAVAILRQKLAHRDTQIWNSPYLLDEQYDGMFKDNNKAAHAAVRELLDRYYGERVRALNKNFLHVSKLDVHILSLACGADTPEKQKQLAQRYYDFIVRKRQKNMGFSLKKVRETILSGLAPDYLGDAYNTVRSKMNKSLDFLCYMYYLEHPEKVDAIVGSLRSLSDELEKDKIYGNAAWELWKAIGPAFCSQVVPRLEELKSSRIDKKKVEELPAELIQDVMIPEKAHYFSELMYLLTLFLDSKEINILLTNLMNKLDNIQSFLNVLTDAGIETAPFTQEYSMFADSGALVEELNTIRSFARMEQADPAAKRQMFLDAARILGDEGSDEEILKYWDQFLDPDRLRTLDNEKKEHGPRNFIASNVIGSDRFRYLVRYLSPEKARKLASCRPLVDFVLKEIPDSQIVRYVNACEDRKIAAYSDGMRDKLAERIVRLRFEDFSEIRQYEWGKTADEKQKAIVGLYLTVLYLAVKNLINVNTRYFIAVHCYERDVPMLCVKYGFTDNEEKAIPYITFVRYWLGSDVTKIKKRVRSYLKDNCENSAENGIRTFRNQIEHLSAIRNADKYMAECRVMTSWFAIYHYLMQRTVKKSDTNPAEKLSVLYEKTVLHHGYCKDLVKALCIPFCYNMARYKALCIDDLFDKDRMPPKDKASKEALSIEPCGE